MAIYSKQLVGLPVAEATDIALQGKQLVGLPVTDLATDLLVRQVVALAVHDYVPLAVAATGRAYFVG